ncbi:MAG: hypothetical protein L0H53_14805 [Candidatus Nitrosocosmicus sp.]|nr:hypothetical protein [Candidatus Nitrosocosmicus sp.]MDN5866984.1 hypothetical protein [Candidatus Nitrosocosmicus sp.]
MKFYQALISLVTSPGNTTGDENKIRRIIEVNDLYKQHKGDNKYENQYSIVCKVYEGENLIESHSITVNKKNLFQIKDKIDVVLNECM